jgi:hypothetical protein
MHADAMITQQGRGFHLTSGTRGYAGLFVEVVSSRSAEDGLREHRRAKCEKFFSLFMMRRTMNVRDKYLQFRARVSVLSPPSITPSAGVLVRRMIENRSSARQNDCATILADL